MAHLEALMSGITGGLLPRPWNPSIRRLAGALFGILAMGRAGSLSGAVILDEVHYDPPEGQQLEFIELHNSGARAVDLTGWRLSSGVRFTFGAGASIAPDGLVVVAKDPAALRERFQLGAEGVLGPFEGALDNGGERLELRTAAGTVVDAFRYDDDEPWDRRAAGEGGSLQRLCADSDSRLPTVWSAAGAPTPLGPTSGRTCPAPAPSPSLVSIVEVHYHSANSNDAHEEFVELRNNTRTTLNLKGHRFTSGLTFEFQEDALVAPGEAVAVCRDPDFVKKLFGVTRVFGPFTGELSNVGERITLVDGAGSFVDSVSYEDHGDWPAVADGLGASLEKIDPLAYSDVPGSWSASDSVAARNRQHVVARGIATSTRLLFELDKTGECMIDNLRLVAVDRPDQNLIPNSTFDGGIGSIALEGTHQYTGWDPTGGTDGTGALRLKAKVLPWGGKLIEDGIIGPPGDVPNRAWVDLAGLVTVNGPEYEVSFDFTYLSGWRGITAGFDGATPERGLRWRLDSRPSATPSMPNTALRNALPPEISNVSRSPAEPSSTSIVTIAARVRSILPLETLELTYWVDLKPAPTTLALLDDGAHGDEEAADGIYGAQLLAFPHNTIITYRLRATDTAGGVAMSPHQWDPTGVHGYYVNDLRPDSKLPIQSVLLQHTSRSKPRTVIDQLDCMHYWTGAFAQAGELYPAVSIRMRGSSVCRTPKPYLKLRFQKGHAFDGQRKLNYQGLWTDKSLVREKLAYEVFNNLGYPACRDEFVRLHANGQYYGLFTAVENVDERFLSRHGLDSDGNLYKSISSNEGPDQGGPSFWEKKTNEDGDHSDLEAFLKDLNAAPITSLRTFFPTRIYEERLIDYQVGQILIDNLDHTSHNHYIHRDPASGKWTLFPWDLDLTFGKSGVFDDGEIIPGFTPWFGTAVDGEFQSYLLDRFFSDAGSWYRRAYLIRLFDQLQERFTEERYAARLDELKGLLFEEQDQDIRMWGRLTDQGGGQFPRDFLSNLARVAYYVQQRRPFLLQYLKSRHRLEGHPRLLITELQYNPSGPSEDLEFIELWNPGAEPVQLSGWSLEAVGYVFPQDTEAAAGEVLVVAKSPVAFEARYGRVARVLGPYPGKLDNKGETLVLRDRGQGLPATIDLVPYGLGDGWPEAADGHGATLELTRVSPWRINDDAASWTASSIDGGTPGVVPGVSPVDSRYFRGDANADGSTNLTDVLVTLGYLFLGSGEPACRAASDVNGSGDIKLDDAVFLLRHLFQGDATPIPFPAPGDCAATPLETCRTSNCR